MTASEVITTLGLPPNARVDQRVPKKLLLENGAPTGADKKQINDGIDELMWLAALKPGTIGVPEYRDAVREYLEIAVLSLALRPEANTVRLVELIHRAIPYPVLLVTQQATVVSVSLAHKRSAQNEIGRVVLDDTVREWNLGSDASNGDWLSALSVSAQPRASLYSIYQGWFACFEAFEAARITGRLSLQSDIAAQEARRKALSEHFKIQKDIATLRGQAEKEKQVNRRVELNLAVRHLEDELKKVTEAL